jgi:hypothetical protein
MNERQLPTTLEHDFIITDESVNRYGWRLLVSGIDIQGFLQNPVCCVQHATTFIPVGKWKNLRKEGQILKGTVEFDRNDPDAVKLYWKYTDGYMNAVSIHVTPLEESRKPEMLLPEQTRPTVVRSELIEISLVTIPGQKNAVKLSTTEGTEYQLSLLTATGSITGLNSGNEVQNLIKQYQQQGVSVKEKEIPYLLSLGQNNYSLVKTILETRKQEM